MSHKSDLIATDIEAYLKQHEEKQLLRFITCGSVDDGKSTLIGRLLYDSKMIYEDDMAKLEADSKIVGTTGGNFDPALLTDGLKAEREQGITIDVAYRYFSTAKRKFIIADTPGHEQYTRNMATGGSTADLAIILVDARHGVMTQTKRHSFIVSLLGSCSRRAIPWEMGRVENRFGATTFKTKSFRACAMIDPLRYPWPIEDPIRMVRGTKGATTFQRNGCG